MSKTKIEWSEHSWNPVTGCTPCSPGCTHCYAERMARRLAGRYGYPEAPHHFDVTLHPGRLDIPLMRLKPTMYFVCSMSDLFHESISDKFISRVWRTMLFAGQHTFQILTKRPKRMALLLRQGVIWAKHWNFDMPLPNVWLGVSVENQAAADERIPYLLQTPAAVRFVSAEPLLGPISFDAIEDKPWHYATDLDGCIVGGESGPGARPMHPNWARSLRDQCQAAGTPYFFKQWGAWAPEAHWKDFSMAQRNRKGAIFSFGGKRFPQDQRMYRVGKKRAVRLLDGRTWDEMPKEVTCS